MSLNRRAYAFFRQHAGGWVGHNAESAMNLARAEQIASERSWEYIWEADDDADMSFVEMWPQREQESYWKSDHTAECVLLQDARGEVLATLGGIVDADDAYRRVIEAELASEALAREESEVRLTVA